MRKIRKPVFLQSKRQYTLLYIMNINAFNLSKLALIGFMAVPLFSSCSDDNDTSDSVIPEDKLVPSDGVFGKATGNFTAEEWYSGGELGTVNQVSYASAAPAVENIAGGTGETSFNKGETFFEREYTISNEPFKGLGPAWVRSSCIHCHPSYGHGKRQDSYKATTYGNGYLLVIYHPTAGSDQVSGSYTANSYIREVTGMPQTKAMSPFKAPIDESGISIEWKTVTSMPSGLSMTFPDGGDTYSLIYPEVTIASSAFNTNPVPDNYEVRLESTIGLYGTGLLDAIDADDMKEQYQKEAQYLELNPNIWDKASNDWASSAWYTLADGTKMVKKFTYAMTRASLQDGPGANAIWNITNVTRSDRHYFYTTSSWANKMAEDNDVISYIKNNGESTSSVLYPYWASTDDGIKSNVKNFLSMSTAALGESTGFKQYFVDGAPYNGEEEMSDKDYYDFMVWHRGLAVPAARNLDNEDVQQGKKLFTEMGCANCHRPSWKTGADNYWVDNCIKAYATANGLDASNILPKYPYQTIWPYTDLVQHRLYMANDIRTGWCRTTPLWGRGLSARLTGADDRLHDCRARTVTEAIMWHAYDNRSDAYESALKFYKLSKADRDAVVAFINAI